MNVVFRQIICKHIGCCIFLLSLFHTCFASSYQHSHTNILSRHHNVAFTRAPSTEHFFVGVGHSIYLCADGSHGRLVHTIDLKLGILVQNTSFLRSTGFKYLFVFFTGTLGTSAKIYCPHFVLHDFSLLKFTQNA